MFILEINAEGIPRYVGPFPSRTAAEKWPSAFVRNGSWEAIEVTPANEAAPKQ